MHGASHPFPLVVLISGNGSNLQAILDAICAGTLPAEVRAVISDRAEAYGLVRARSAGVSAHMLLPSDFPDREGYDRALQALVDRFDPGLVVLAGFMRILSAEFVRHFHGRMINIHPSLLPKFPGLHTHQAALAAGEKEHGCTVHFVTEALDQGPIIAQEKLTVAPEDTVETLRNRVLALEHQLYPRVIRWFAEGQLP